MRLAYHVDGFEVVVVDDGSRTPLDGVVEPFRNKLNITLIRQRNQGPGAARNAGALVARGHFLAFTDDDCRPASDWLQKLETRFGDTPDGMIGGRVISPLKHNAYSTASQLVIDMAYAFYNQNPYHPFLFTSNNMAVPAELFQKVKNQYSRSKAGRLALPELAFMRLQEKKYDEAISLYSEFLG